jgi:hypothetical protein
MLAHDTDGQDQVQMGERSGRVKDTFTFMREHCGVGPAAHEGDRDYSFIILSQLVAKPSS